MQSSWSLHARLLSTESPFSIMSRIIYLFSDHAIITLLLAQPQRTQMPLHFQKLFFFQLAIITLLSFWME